MKLLVIVSLLSLSISTTFSNERCSDDSFNRLPLKVIRTLCQATTGDTAIRMMSFDSLTERFAESKSTLVWSADGGNFDKVKERTIIKLNKSDEKRGTGLLSFRLFSLDGNLGFYCDDGECVAGEKEDMGHNHYFFEVGKCTILAYPGEDEATVFKHIM